MKSSVNLINVSILVSYVSLGNSKANHRFPDGGDLVKHSKCSIFDKSLRMKSDSFETLCLVIVISYSLLKFTLLLDTFTQILLSMHRK